jgi:hypothetical protein
LASFICEARVGAESSAGGADRLVRLLRALRFRFIEPRFFRQVLGAVEVLDLAAGGAERLARQGQRVGAHICDVTVLIQALCNPHGAAGVKSQLAARLLLQGRGHEGRVGAVGEGLLCDVGDLEGSVLQLGRQSVGLAAVENQRLRLELAGLLVEVLADRDLAAIELGQTGGEAACVLLTLQCRLDAAECRLDETHPRFLAGDDQSRGDRLHAPGRQLGSKLLPQHRRDLVTDQAVEDTAGLLRVDQPLVDFTRLRQGVADSAAGDLVENQPHDGDVGLQYLDQMPGDGLALAVFVSCEVELRRLLELLFEGRDLLLLVGGDHVERLEVVVDVDAEARPLLALVLLGNLGRGRGQVADVADRGLHHPVRSQEPGNGPRLGRRLDDDERFCLGHAAHRK